jgi:RNA polymerase sigma factor (sigma-70 family)
MNSPDKLNKGGRLFTDISEQELWDKITAGEQAALAYLYQMFVKGLFKYGYFLVPDKDIVEDAIHDLFIRIWTNRNNHIKIHSIKSYLFVSLRREVLARKNEFINISHRLNMIEDELGQQPSIEETIISGEGSQEMIKKVKSFINNLTSRQREIIHLRFYQNLSYPEISELLGIDQNYAYNLSSKALAQIKKYFTA